MRLTRWRLAAASLLTAVGVDVLSLATAKTTWALAAVLVASLGVAALIAALLDRSRRAVPAAAGLIVGGAAFAGLGRAGGAGASLTLAALGALTLVSAELAWWSIDMGGIVPAGGLDKGRLATIGVTALGGAAFGGFAVGLAYANTRTGSLAIAVSGCIAACLIVGLAVVLAPGARRTGGGAGG